VALVVLLKGVNVGGHRAFRPSVFAKALSRFDVVSVGAAGTFVIHKRVSRGMLRAEMLRRLPFETEVVVCRGSDVVRVVSEDPFADYASGPNVVRFVTVLARRPVTSPKVPLDLPSGGEWSLKIVAHEHQFVFGLYRREMRAIRYLGQLEKIFDVAATTRNWNTMLAIVQVLKRAG
jgi:uncharacterized protein (DUF1697 family)